ncbi:hypothetical protein, partial [Streptomyces sp. TRM68416]|uniref:hypothetical protein n=1 Tax=Streptomyces sp. TRM68416 TaxID=2758412 RepID=UPI001CB70923
MSLPPGPVGHRDNDDQGRSQQTGDQCRCREPDGRQDSDRGTGIRELLDRALLVGMCTAHVVSRKTATGRVTAAPAAAEGTSVPRVT